MVVFEDGLPARASTAGSSSGALDGQDDVAAMHEVITRRFRRYLEERDGDSATRPTPPATGGRRGRADRPGDRHAAQVRLPAQPGRRRRRPAAGRRGARRRWTSSGIDDVALCGLAKRLEEVWLPGEDEPVILPRTSEALYLLQRVRDEAHRFAITYHRQKRSKAMIESAAGRGARSRRDPAGRRC